MSAGAGLDKSIAFILPVLSFLSHVSSSFIFMPQQLLWDLSVFLPLSTSGSLTGNQPSSLQPHWRYKKMRQTLGKDNNLSLIKKWWSLLRITPLTLKHSTPKWAISILYWFQELKIWGTGAQCVKIGSANNWKCMIQTQDKIHVIPWFIGSAGVGTTYFFLIHMRKKEDNNWTLIQYVQKNAKGVY